MRRRLFNLAAAFSLLLFLATTALSARGRWVWSHEALSVQGPHPSTGLIHYEVSNGPLAVTATLAHYRSDGSDSWRRPIYLRTPSTATDGDTVDESFRASGARGVAGVWLLSMPNPGMYGMNLSSYRLLHIPHWTLALLTGILPAAWAVGRWRRGRTITAGCCPCRKCGYDLRATPDRCPECGAARKLATDGAPIATD